MIEYPDLTNFSREELVEEYCKLFDRFLDFRETNEADRQKIHDLKRSLETATAAQAYLSRELEQYTNSDNNKIEEEFHKAQAELQDVKKKYENLKVSFASLQQDYNLLLEENKKISQNLEESHKRQEQLPSESDANIFDDYLLRIQVLENENMDLLQQIENFEERSMRYTLTIAECEKNIEILRDQIVCLEENLQSKRIDLEENAQILESTQEQLVKANMEIAVLSAAPNNNDRKGNSLFAEVDDQRQVMKLRLKAQKQSYLQMKIKYDESEHEIRRLKRENISMRTELEACSAIFCNADKIYQEKLNERVHNLLNQNEELERKLKWTEERLKELAIDKGVLFLDSMFSFCKKETDDLKSQLHCVRIQKACLEEQLRNAQQEVARWRFESLKSRCVLIDREDLLTENKIAFKPIHAMEFNISEKDLKEAKPRIVSNRRSSIFENVIDRKSLTPSNELIKQDEASENPINDNLIPNTANVKQETILNASINSIEIPIKEEKEEEEVICKKDLSCRNIKEIADDQLNNMIVDKTKLNESLNMSKDKQHNNNNANEDKENNTAYNSTEDIFKLNKIAKPPTPMRPAQRSLKTPTPPARSILTKPGDLVLMDCGKSVKFASNLDTVHNLSLETLSPISSKANNEDDSNFANGKLDSKTPVKKTRNKSNIIVRRVVLNAKHHD